MTIRAYIFDIDGTLANRDHRLHHVMGENKDWGSFFTECHLDTPYNHILKLALDLQKSGAANILFVTGRPWAYRSKTAEWLKNAGLNVERNLLMRADSDRRPDHLVKLDILEVLKNIGFEIIMAFDDRNSVVKMWRENGVPCAQVQEGYF